MPSRSKKNQAERLRRKRFWQDVADAGAIIREGEFAGSIDANKLQAFRATQV